MSETTRLRFGPFVLDEARASVVLPDGDERQLRPKSFDLLRHLVANAQRVVTRAEILDAVWPGLFVTDDSVTQCMTDIRRALGDTGGQVIRTVPRRGYLLQAEVTAEARRMPVSNGNAARVVAPLPTETPSIAVLPFRGDPNRPEDRYFAEGIIEGIVHVLSGLEGLTVLSLGTSLAQAGHDADVRTVGRALGARYLLRGTLRRSGGRLRLYCELVLTETGAVVRADLHEGSDGDLFALQDRISTDVAVTIAPRVREQELALARRKPPANLTAYDLVLQALDRMHRLERPAFDEARGLLEAAVEADPAYGPARTYVAWWHIWRMIRGWSDDRVEDGRAADMHTTEALQLNSRDALGLAIRSLYLSYQLHRHEEAIELLGLALQSSPNCAFAWAHRAAVECWTGSGLIARDMAERALRLAPTDPFSFLYQAIVAQACYTVDDFDSAIDWAGRSIAANPREASAHRVLVAALVAAGRPTADAVASLRAADPDFRLSVFAGRTPLVGTRRDLFVARLQLAGIGDD
ncbi:MAG: winged helix-turn-helix domain-containing tetratricopeptide repeat protein [Rhodospirillales bacterium]|jgi:adenylate cyclase